jgi:ELWxxDGT repeat protein
MVEDTVPGEESGDPSTLTEFGGTLFFGVSDPTDGSRDLWTSDGTAAGTALVKDFDVDGDERGYLPRIVVVGDRMFFFTGASGGVELWTSDGTEAGTMLVKGVPLGYNSGGPGELTAVGDTLYFYIGGYSVAGADLWRSDGTEAGTTVIEHIDSPTYGGPGGLTASGGKLFFAVDDSAHGNELWVSDGTGPGTHLVRDIDPSVMFVSRAARTGAANATARVQVTVYSSGTVKVAPARMGGVRKLRQELVFDGNWYWDVANLTLDLTRAAKRELRRTGRVEIGARFTYTSCAGPIKTEKRTYTLTKRR